jgi:hypothetical protein
MSAWTQVIGCIRYNSIRLIFLPRKEAEKILINLLGVGIDFCSLNKTTKIPLGSEGSLKYNIVADEEKNYVGRYSVHIVGSLRDYGETDADIEKIHKWFEEITIGAVKNDIADGVEGVLQYNAPYRGNTILTVTNDETIRVIPEEL